MASIKLAAEKDKPPPYFSKRKGYIALGCILGLSLFYLLRSCTLDTFMEATYYIGQDSRWQNLNLMGKERNFSAFNNDLLGAIAKQEHIRIHLSATHEADLIPQLEKGNLQGALTSLQSSYLNENRLIFSDPYFRIGPVLIIPLTAPINGWNEKRKKIIGIQRSTAHSLLNLEQDPSIEIKLYNDFLSALTDLSERRIDGAILSAIPAYIYVSTFFKNELKIATLPLTDEGVRLATLKNERGELLIKHFNEGLAALKQNGTYQKILESWGLIDIEQIVDHASP
jgi:polar amino acid transport system substrate-binding protein